MCFRGRILDKLCSWVHFYFSADLIDLPILNSLSGIWELVCLVNVHMFSGLYYLVIYCSCRPIYIREVFYHLWKHP